MNIRRLSRGPGTQAAIGVITTGLLGLAGATFYASHRVVAYALLSAAAFRFYIVVRDFRRATAD